MPNDCQSALEAEDRQKRAALNTGRQTEAGIPIVRQGDLRKIVSICSLLAMMGWVVPAIIASYAPAQDFMVFYTAARASIEGHLPLLFDGNAFTAQLNERFGDWLAMPLSIHPWVYPPLFLLMVIPIGYLPFLTACGGFLLVTFIFLNCALRFYIPPGYQRWLCAGSLLLSPATAFTVAVGQNSFLTAALLVGGFGLMRRLPWLAGAMLGVLTCKPQLWVLIPVALFAAREWKVLAGAIASASLLTLVSLAVFGIEPWRQWLTLMLGSSPQYQQWLPLGRLNGQSIYTEAVLLGAAPGIASAIQNLVILLCAIVVWWTFRTSSMRRDLQLAVLLTMTILAAPHVSNYDAVMVTVAVSLFLCRALEDGFRHGDAMLIIVVWSIEILDPPLIIRWGLVTPLVLALFAAAVIARGRSDAKAHVTPASPLPPVPIHA